jgi:hypothetical protein
MATVAAEAATAAAGAAAGAKVIAGVRPAEKRSRKPKSDTASPNAAVIKVDKGGGGGIKGVATGRKRASVQEAEEAGGAQESAEEDGLLASPQPNPGPRGSKSKRTRS